MDKVNSHIAIPHKPPMLFITEVVNKYENSIECHFQTDADMVFFKGHFPGNPIMPGVIMLEFLFQCSLMYELMKHKLCEQDNNFEFYAAGVQKARFLQAIRPGDLLLGKVTFLKQRKHFYWYEGEVFVNEKLCCASKFNAYGRQNDDS